MSYREKIFSKKDESAVGRKDILKTNFHTFTDLFQIDSHCWNKNSNMSTDLKLWKERNVFNENIGMKVTKISLIISLVSSSIYTNWWRKSKFISKHSKMGVWPGGLRRINWKVLFSNPTMCSTGFRDRTSLWGSSWQVGQTHWWTLGEWGCSLHNGPI